MAQSSPDWIVVVMFVVDCSEEAPVRTDAASVQPGRYSRAELARPEALRPGETSQIVDAALGTYRPGVGTTDANEAPVTTAEREDLTRHDADSLLPCPTVQSRSVDPA